MVVGLVQMLIEAGEIDPLPLETAARIVHSAAAERRPAARRTR
jgi:hypothetical protein